MTPGYTEKIRVELFGGPMDGTTLAIRGVPRSLEFAVPAVPTVSDFVEDVGATVEWRWRETATYWLAERLVVISADPAVPQLTIAANYMWSRDGLAPLHPRPSS